MRMRGWPVIGVVALASVLLGGCGGGSSGTTDARTAHDHGPPTKADWIDKADATCQRALREDGPVATEASSDVLTKGRALLQRLGRELEAIPVPPSQVTQIERLMRALNSTVGLMDEERRQTDGSGKLRPLEMDQVVTAIGGPITTTDQEFSRYGARTCGEVTLGFPSG